MGDDTETLTDTMTYMLRKQDEMSANTMQLLHQQSTTIEDLNNTFLQNRETIKSDLRSTGTSTSGYTHDDFIRNYPFPKFTARSWEQLQTTPPKQDSKQTSDLQLGCGNSPRPPPFNPGRNPTSDLQLGRGNSPRPHPLNQDSKLTTDSQMGLGNSPRPILFSLNDKPTEYSQFGQENSPRPSSQNLNDRQTGSVQSGRGNSPRSTGDYEGFIPFNRAARRNEWTEEKKQHNEKNDEFAEEVRRLVSVAYPTSSIELQEELAAEHFLKGHKNTKIAYEALNRQPKTVSSALDIVVQLQNMLRWAGMLIIIQKQRARRVTWKDEEENSNGQYEGMESVRQLVNSFRKPDNQTLQNEIKALRDLLEKAFEGFKTSYLDSTVNGMLFLWRKKPFQT
ncbi:Hypothetical predicted protein [Mytilus galloprovincialis]|uniref:Uncharacterized protein n=1 Tax=Mytilus galloprovincialis TaxID=29158 RepID=A0A8B6C0B5_MYTGA|nr:Hypothetical predicted protein [Mytilus galloprovincialis]